MRLGNSGTAVERYALTTRPSEQVRGAGKDEVHWHHHRDAARLLPQAASEVRVAELCSSERAETHVAVSAARCSATAALAWRYVLSCFCNQAHANATLPRYQVGVQSCYEDVARDTNRGHTVQATCESFHMAKDAGFKVVSHMMVGFSSHLLG